MRAILCWVLCLTIASSWAGEPLRLPLSQGTLPPATTYWYGVYVEGTKVGWIRLTLGLTPEGRLIEEWENHASLLAMGELIDVRSTQRIEFDSRPPFAIVKSSTDSVAGATRQSMQLERTNEGLEGKSKSPGGEQHVRFPALQYTFEDTWTTLDWFRHAPVIGDELTVRSLDLEAARVDLDTYYVDEVGEGIVQGVMTRWYRGRTISSSGGEIGTYTAVSTGDFAQFSFAGTYEARLEDEISAKQIGRSKDLFTMGEVGIDAALGDPTSAYSLTLEVEGESAGRLKDGPRQSVEMLEDGRRLLKIGSAHGHATPATAREMANALESTIELPAKDPRIAALTARAIDGAYTAEEKVARLVRFVSDYVEDVLSPVGAFNALDVLASRKGDCTEHAVLFAAMARAAGVPARRVSGLLYMGDNVRAFGGHAWNEVVLDGHWVPVDATWNQVAVDATHVAIGAGEEGEMAHLWLIGRLKFKLVSIERRP